MIINSLIRVGKFQSTFLPSSSIPRQQKTVGGIKISGVGFQQTNTEPENPTMEHNQQQQQNPNNPNEQTGDVMSHSFGEGYATRSDEEGFGGIYGGNQSLPLSDEDKSKIIHENHPEYDKTQGSEVSEKEKGRHQVKID